ncbi:MAG: DUF1592 domain-containing protein [Verrucomicrobiales bacterium]|nr:DUF1592 domain-containing protein [Verrucomicrobiales bacterium]
MGLSFSKVLLPLPAIIFLAAAPLLSADVPPEKVDAFLAENCFECHDDEVSKGELNLLDLKFDLTDPHLFEKWERVFSRAESGEMPPKKKPRPDSGQLKAFLAELEKPLLAADEKRIAKEGRVNVRRLTRREYEMTLHDLLKIDIPLIDHLPEDSSHHGFETVAGVQQLSHHLLGRYLETAELALDEAVQRATTGWKKPYTKTINAKMLGRGAKSGGNYRGPEDREGRAIAWPISLQFYGRMPATSVPEDGWYRITIKDVQAVNADVVWGTLRSGPCSSSAPILYPIGLVEATKEKRDLTFEAWIRKRDMLEMKPGDITIKKPKSPSKGGNVIYRGTDFVKDGVTGIAMGSIEMTRIYPNGSAKEVRAALIGNISKKQLEESTPEEMKKIISNAIQNFAGRAFRRPVSRDVTQPYIDLALEVLKEQGAKPVDALTTGYRAILCSPRFLTFYEKPGRLDQYALANRLSYMLWNSMPDQGLRQLADKGKLSGNVIHQQFSRMLDDPKSDRFFESFSDQWLKLKEIDFTSPDTRRFRTFDPVVQESMVAETRSFLSQIIRGNAPVTTLIHSDFAMLNERLVRFYAMKELDLKPGNGIQKVSLKTNPRGGLVTQGSILKVTADGSSTSPIVRGVYIAERFLGMEIPPPPPGIPAVEPDIRGAVSIRDQLDKHRNNESCAACHQKIDPAGFALESFDPVGLWRSKYGWRKNSAKVDPSGQTPEGDPFKDIFSWKKVYLKQPDLLAEAFAKQVLTYATGSPPSFSDRDAIEKIVKSCREKKYGMRSLMHGIVASDPFRTK